jgi:4,5-DOPA dioxygenase extradiol
MATAADPPPTLHDFGGPPALFQLQYPAPGSPELTREITERLVAAGMKAVIDRERGMDHGVWIPLMLMFPEADIPVVQVSVQTEESPQYHLQMGQALADLRNRGVLILGSGGATHDLDSAPDHPKDAHPAAYAAAFDDWLHECVRRNRREALLDYLHQAPHPSRNHPYPAEHWLPFFVPLGAASSEISGRRVHAGFLHGVLSMAAYVWENG